MRSWPSPRHLWVALLPVLTACSEMPVPQSAGRPPARPETPLERSFAPVHWELMFRVGGTTDDLRLAMPSRPALASHGAYIADTYLKQIQFFDLAGNLAWTFGAEGSGPGEFRLPRDLKTDAHDRAWIVDPNNARITILTPDGQLGREISLQRLDRRPDRVVPLRDGTAIIINQEPDSPFVRIDSLGNVLSRTALPLKGLEELGPLGAQMASRGDPHTNRWSAAFLAGDGFFSFDGEQPRHPHAWYVVPAPWPEIVIEQSGNTTTRRMKSPTGSATSIAVDDDRVLVHMEGTDSLRLRVLDVYSAVDGYYLESITLPRRYAEIDFRDDVLLGIYTTPYPGVEAWRMRRTPTP